MKIFNIFVTTGEKTHAEILLCYFLDIYSPVEFIPIRGHGSRLYDKNNFEVIDFAGGVAVNSLGLTNQVLIDVLHEQSQKLWHVGNVMTNYPQIELAKKLVNNSDFDKVFLCNSGTEAVESAVTWYNINSGLAYPTGNYGYGLDCSDYTMRVK